MKLDPKMPVTLLTVYSKVNVRSVLSRFSRMQLFVTQWTVAHKAPLCMDFSRQEYWSGFPCPSPEDLSDPGIEPMFPTLQADYLPFELPRMTLNIFEVVSKTSTNDLIDCFLHFTK